MNDVTVGLLSLTKEVVVVTHIICQKSCGHNVPLMAIHNVFFSLIFVQCTQLQKDLAEQKRVCILVIFSYYIKVNFTFII